MRIFKPTSARLCRAGLAFAALMSIAAVATPAAADDWNHRHRHDDRGSFSFGFSAPGYYDPPGYYYAPPPRPYYYYPPPVYYPPPRYYEPGPSFNLVIPFGSRH
jgi:hypothetical protein